MGSIRGDKTNLGRNMSRRIQFYNCNRHFEVCHRFYSYLCCTLVFVVIHKDRCLHRTRQLSNLLSLTVYHLNHTDASKNPNWSNYRPDS